MNTATSKIRKRQWWMARILRELRFFLAAPGEAHLCIMELLLELSHESARIFRRAKRDRTPMLLILAIAVVRLLTIKL